jgi:hypothetical protein
VVTAFYIRTPSCMRCRETRRSSRRRQPAQCTRQEAESSSTRSDALGREQTNGAGSLAQLLAGSQQTSASRAGMAVGAGTGYLGNNPAKDIAGTAIGVTVLPAVFASLHGRPIRRSVLAARHRRRPDKLLTRALSAVRLGPLGVLPARADMGSERAAAYNPVIRSAGRMYLVAPQVVPEAPTSGRTQ